MPADVADPIRAALAEAARAEELHASLAPALVSARSAVLKVIVGPPPPPPPLPPPLLPPVVPPKPDPPIRPVDPDEVVLTIPATELHHRLMRVEGEIRAALRRRPGSQVRITWRVE